MGASGRERHRDRHPNPRQGDDEPPPPSDRRFRITDAQRQVIASALRFIDEARLALVEQQNRENREIIRELKASADRIYDVLNDLEETD